VPLATIILAILAVPLSRTQPRAGRYGRIAIGLLVFIIYLNMLSAAKAWIEQGTISPTLGLWWVHAAVFLLAMGLLAYQSMFHRRVRL
jgi:lipopolysaccharide export system permease protein